MNHRAATIVLVLICGGLVVALIWSQRRAANQEHEDADNIAYYSNQLVQTSATLDQQRQVNTSLEGDLNNQRAAFRDLTNAFTRLSANFEKAETSGKAFQEEVSRRGTRIADLESQKLALDQRALDLSTTIASLKTQVDDTLRTIRDLTNRPTGSPATNSPLVP
jgi:chromosome segregation ATPase